MTVGCGAHEDIVRWLHQSARGDAEWEFVQCHGEQGRDAQAEVAADLDERRGPDVEGSSASGL
jgi:hypothetical protein